MTDPSPIEGEDAENFARWLADARGGDLEALGRVFKRCRRYVLQGVRKGVRPPVLMASDPRSDSDP